ncbi:hypothetical protein AFI02nite_38830 [Aliivibrio fischeri]|uniref:Uncharacterized protein n=1 Tax=Aliivibrio fischeri TaxID=668 RepID=A0A510UMJ5_ALIFS|nr:hypothetical protein AFI02nite_38830 [Aliivibrio fischeri]
MHKCLCLSICNITLYSELDINMTVKHTSLDFQNSSIALKSSLFINNVPSFNVISDA